MTPEQQAIYDRHRQEANAWIVAHPLAGRSDWCSCVMVGKPCYLAKYPGLPPRPRRPVQDTSSAEERKGKVRDA